MYSTISPSTTDDLFADFSIVILHSPGGGGVSLTLTVRLHSTEPPGPVATPVYTVVSVGETDFNPPPIGVTDPMPLSIVNVVACVVLQVSVEVFPFFISLGDAESVHVGFSGGGGGGGKPHSTLMMILHVAVPPGPVTVALYVVVSVGETTFEPPATGVTEPMPLSIEIDDALSVVHESVEEPPNVVIVVGDAESTQLGSGGGGGGTSLTLTVFWHSTAPPGPVAVKVYVLVVPGTTVLEPLEAGVTAPTPWSIDTIVAFVVVHERTVDCVALVSEYGIAVNVQVGGGGGGGGVVTVTVSEHVTVPPGPVAVPVYVVVYVGATVLIPEATGVTDPTE